ncbi:MAG: hypothetical protein EZS28_043835, partial [Streblomastix strix]
MDDLPEDDINQTGPMLLGQFYDLGVEFAKAENVFPVKELAEAIGGQTLTEQDAQQLLINFFWYPGQY